MKLCDACRRHVRSTEGACPFCGRSLRTTAAARLGAVLLLGALETACSSRPVEDETGSDTATPSTTTSEGGTTSSSPTGTTTTTATSTTTTSGPATTETSSTGELSSTGDIDTSDTGCSFYGGCPADFANPIECNPFQQDCPEGQKCSAQKSDGEFFDATKCVPVARDPDQPGEPCTVEGALGSGLDSCDVGSICWHVDEQTLAGTCVPLCGGTPDFPECPATTSCVSFGQALDLCLPACDPLAPACPLGDLCIFNPLDPENPFACVDDVSENDGVEFEPCEFLDDCNLGLVCVEAQNAAECDPMVAGCCVAYCDLTAPACTGAGAECVPWFEPGEAPSGSEDVGVCALPP